MTLRNVGGTEVRTCAYKYVIYSRAEIIALTCSQLERLVQKVKCVQKKEYLCKTLRSAARNNPDGQDLSRFQDVRGQEAQAPSGQDHQALRGAHQERREALCRTDQRGQSITLSGLKRFGSLYFCLANKFCTRDAALSYNTAVSICPRRASDGALLCCF